MLIQALDRLIPATYHSKSLKSEALNLAQRIMELVGGVEGGYHTQTLLNHHYFGEEEGRGRGTDYTSSVLVPSSHDVSLLSLRL